jgi:hypothetical protein
MLTETASSPARVIPASVQTASIKVVKTDECSLEEWDSLRAMTDPSFARATEQTGVAVSILRIRPIIF